MIKLGIMLSEPIANAANLAHEVVKLGLRIKADRSLDLDLGRSLDRSLDRLANRGSLTGRTIPTVILDRLEDVPSAIPSAPIGGFRRLTVGAH